MKNTSNKSKVSPTQDELESEFYNLKRAKPTGKALADQDFAKDKENTGENELIHIKLASSSTRKAFTELNQELKAKKRESEPKLNKESKLKKEDEKSEQNKSSRKFEDILDCKFTPNKILFREKEELQIIKFIFK
jgi:hypothetical protein